MDDVRAWFANVGTMTTPDQDARTTNVPIQTEVLDTVTSMDPLRKEVQSSADNTTWAPWTTVEGEMASRIFAPTPDRAHRRCHQTRVTRTSGFRSAPSLTLLPTTEGTPMLCQAPRIAVGGCPASARA